jgi:hypothetical protein
MTSQPAGESNSSVAPKASGDLLEAVTGKQAARDCAVANRTRRVVLTSLGVLEEQKEGRRRTRAFALACLLLALLVFGPLMWHLAEELIAGEHMSDMATQTSLWACILCPAVLAAILVAGWSRRKS